MACLIPDVWPLKYFIEEPNEYDDAADDGNAANYEDLGEHEVSISTKKIKADRKHDETNIESGDVTGVLKNAHTGFRLSARMNVLVCFMINTIVQVLMSFVDISIKDPSLLMWLDVSETEAQRANNFFKSMIDLNAPIALYLMTKSTYKNTVVVGALLVCVSFTNITFLNIGNEGAISWYWQIWLCGPAALGISCLKVGAIIPVLEYFKKSRMNMLVVTKLGTVLGAVVTIGVMFADDLSWRILLRINAGVCIPCIVIAFLLKEITVRDDKTVHKENTGEGTDNTVANEVENMENVYNKSEENTEEMKEKEENYEETAVEISAENVDNTDTVHQNRRKCFDGIIEAMNKTSKFPMLRNLEDDNEETTGKQRNMPKKTQSGTQKSKITNRLYTLILILLKRMFDIPVLTKISFWIIMVVYFFFGFGNSLPTFSLPTIPDELKDQLAPPVDSFYEVLAANVGYLIGLLVTYLLQSLNYLKRSAQRKENEKRMGFAFNIITLSGYVMGILSILTQDDFIYYLVYILVLTIFEVLAENFRDETMSTAFGLKNIRITQAFLRLSVGLAGVSASVVQNSINEVDNEGGLNLNFRLGGGFYLISALIPTISIIWQCCMRTQGERQSSGMKSIEEEISFGDEVKSLYDGEQNEQSNITADNVEVVSCCSRHPILVCLSMGKKCDSRIEPLDKSSEIVNNSEVQRPVSKQCLSGCRGCGIYTEKSEENRINCHHCSIFTRCLNIFHWTEKDLSLDSVRRDEIDIRNKNDISDSEINTKHNKDEKIFFATFSCCRNIPKLLCLSSNKPNSENETVIKNDSDLHDPDLKSISPSNIQPVKNNTDFKSKVVRLESKTEQNDKRFNPSKCFSSFCLNSFCLPEKISNENGTESHKDIEIQETFRQAELDTDARENEFQTQNIQQESEEECGIYTEQSEENRINCHHCSIFTRCLNIFHWTEKDSSLNSERRDEIDIRNKNDISDSEINTKHNKDEKRIFATFSCCRNIPKLLCLSSNKPNSENETVIKNDSELHDPDLKSISPSNIQSVKNNTDLKSKVVRLESKTEQNDKRFKPSKCSSSFCLNPFCLPEKISNENGTESHKDIEIQETFRQAELDTDARENEFQTQNIQQESEEGTPHLYDVRTCFPILRPSKLCDMLCRQSKSEKTSSEIRSSSYETGMLRSHSSIEINRSECQLTVGTSIKSNIDSISVENLTVDQNNSPIQDYVRETEHQSIDSKVTFQSTSKIQESAKETKYQNFVSRCFSALRPPRLSDLCYQQSKSKNKSFESDSSESTRSLSLNKAKKQDRRVCEGFIIQCCSHISSKRSTSFESQRSISQIENNSSRISDVSLTEINEISNKGFTRTSTPKNSIRSNIKRSFSEKSYSGTSTGTSVEGNISQQHLSSSINGSVMSGYSRYKVDSPLVKDNASHSSNNSLSKSQVSVDKPLTDANIKKNKQKTKQLDEKKANYDSTDKTNSISSFKTEKSTTNTSSEKGLTENAKSLTDSNNAKVEDNTKQPGENDANRILTGRPNSKDSLTKEKDTVETSFEKGLTEYAKSLTKANNTKQPHSNGTTDLLTEKANSKNSFKTDNDTTDTSSKRSLINDSNTSSLSSLAKTMNNTQLSGYEKLLNRSESTGNNIADKAETNHQNDTRNLKEKSKTDGKGTENEYDGQPNHDKKQQNPKKIEKFKDCPRLKIALAPPTEPIYRDRRLRYKPFQPPDDIFQSKREETPEKEKVLAPPSSKKSLINDSNTSSLPSLAKTMNNTQLSGYENLLNSSESTENNIADKTDTNHQNDTRNPREKSKKGGKGKDNWYDGEQNHDKKQQNPKNDVKFKDCPRLKIALAPPTEPIYRDRRLRYTPFQPPDDIFQSKRE